MENTVKIQHLGERWFVGFTTISEKSDVHVDLNDASMVRFTVKDLGPEYFVSFYMRSRHTVEFLVSKDTFDRLKLAWDNYLLDLEQKEQ